MLVEAKFDGLHTEVQNELRKANRSVSIAVAWITFRLYVDIFKELIDKDVSVNIVCTNSPPNNKQSKLIEELIDYGVSIRLCAMPRQTNHMHHKFAIIDSSTILNGSFNWSENAKNSFENLTIIRNAPDLANSFIQEYEKIEALDKAAIKSLQSIEKCREQSCDGELANLLVFQSSPLRMTYEVLGDVIQCCSVCGEESNTIIENAIQDTQLHSFLSKHELELTKEESILFDRHYDSHLTGYSSQGIVIHGIGFVCRELSGRHEEDIYTKIIWKNKFVSDSVRDRYETDFGVLYE